MQKAVLFYSKDTLLYVINYNHFKSVQERLYKWYGISSHNHYSYTFSDCYLFADFPGFFIFFLYKNEKHRKRCYIFLLSLKNHTH